MYEIDVQTFIARQEMRAVRLEAELVALKDAARALLADLDAHATGSMGETQDALDALVREK